MQIVKLKQWAFECGYDDGWFSYWAQIGPWLVIVNDRKRTDF